MKRKRQRTTARNAPLPNASRSDSPPGAGPARAAERLSGPIPDAGAPDLDLGHLLRGVAARGGAAKMLNSEIEHGPGPVAAALRLALSMVSGERRELVRQAEKLTDAAAILDFLEAHPDVMLATILEERARSCEADMVARLLPRLPANPPEHVAEFAALFLARAREDYTTQVLHVAKRVRDAYPLGLLCLLLGVIDRGEFGLQFVWNVYRHLNREFGSPLDQAPLFGLVRYANRRKEAKAVPKEGTHPSH